MSFMHILPAFGFPAFQQPFSNLPTRWRGFGETAIIRASNEREAMSSIWDRENVTSVIQQILRSAPIDRVYGTGRRFLTAYQIAIELARHHSHVAAAIGHATGGEGHGPFAITTYVARWLPDRIQRGLANDIEMQFLSSEHLSAVELDNYGSPITATANQAGFDMIMFRIIDQSEPTEERR